MNFIKNEFLEVIEWIDDTTDTVIYKFPDNGNKIMNGAKLTVRESQVCVMMHEGAFGDEYAPGAYELSTPNMPITTTLKSWKYLFDDPFKVDLFFVSTKQFASLKWGTSTPLIMRDPEFKQVRIRAFGTYTMKIVDAKKFIKEFSGTNALVKIDAVSEQLRNVIVGKLVEGMAETGVSVIDLAANFTEIGEKLRPIYQQEFSNWGIELGRFYIDGVSLPDDVEKMMDKSTELNMLSDKFDQYAQLQNIKVLEKLADNPDASGISGIGAGFLFTNMMNQQLGPNNQNPQQAQQSAGANNNQQKMIELLKQLGELKAAGILTEEEFNQKKTEILGKL